MEEWRSLQDYPGYSISNMGRVRNDDRDRLLSIARKPDGYAYVGLIENRIQVKRSVALLVAKTFLHPPQYSTFTTPIHFDGDLSNCQVENMDWRPRWFALKHARQFRIKIAESPNPILNLDTEERFENCWGAVFRYGLLYIDLLKAIIHRETVFPTAHHYKWNYLRK